MGALRHLADVDAQIWRHPANRRRQVRALARATAWQAWERVTDRPWTVRFAGMRLRCHPGCAVGSDVVYFGVPDWDELHFLRRFLRAGDVFVDVGAHVGMYAMAACSVPGTTVVAVEPSSQAFARLRDNVALNRLEARIRLVNAGAWSAEGTGGVTRDLGTMNRVVPGTSGRDVEAVPLRTLDDVVGDLAPHVALVKIDVEGGEREVLAGAERLLRERRPVLLVEAIFDGEALCTELTKRYGYRLFAYSADERRVRPIDGPAEMPGKNVIAAPDLDTLTRRTGGAATP